MRIVPNVKTLGLAFYTKALWINMLRTAQIIVHLKVPVQFRYFYLVLRSKYSIRWESNSSYVPAYKGWPWRICSSFACWIPGSDWSRRELFERQRESTRFGCRWACRGHGYLNTSKLDENHDCCRGCYPVARPIFPPHATAISANPVTFFLTRTYEKSKQLQKVLKKMFIQDPPANHLENPYLQKCWQRKNRSMKKL